MNAGIHKSFDELFSLSNLFIAWREFRRGKTCKRDVMDFELHLEDNIFRLFEQLQSGLYKHSPYMHFQIFDNKKRDIYKAEIEDRIVHQIIYDYLLGIFEPIFISDSYASRVGKGQSKAVKTFRYFIKLSGSSLANHSGNCYVLKCDIKKYFDSVDQKFLFSLISNKMFDKRAMEIISEIVSSYNSKYGHGKGIPLEGMLQVRYLRIFI